MQIRDAVESDLPFILATWINGLRYGSEFYHNMDRDSYFTKYQQIIKHIISKSTIKVACDDIDNDMIYGYAVIEPGVLHWVYVKEAYRHKGIMNSLLDKHQITYITHETKTGQAIAEKRGWRLDMFRI